MGVLEGRPFIYVAAFGAFTDVAYDTPQDLKKTFGHLAYVIAALGNLSSVTEYPLTIEYDGGVLEGKFLLGMVCNTFTVGGVRAFPEDKIALDDGQFEVLLLRKPGSVADLNQLLVTLTQQKPVEGGALTVLRTARLVITSESSLPWTIDGEYGGSYLRSEIQVRQRAIVAVEGGSGAGNREAPDIRDAPEPPNRPEDPQPSESSISAK
jgi:diacylglycerol kinase family enzyme